MIDFIPTAEMYFSILKKDSELKGNTTVDPIQFAIDFAKFHVQNAIKKIEALPNIKLEEGITLVGAINRSQIADAYPLTNIK